MLITVATVHASPFFLIMFCNLPLYIFLICHSPALSFGVERFFCHSSEMGHSDTCLSPAWHSVLLKVVCYEMNIFDSSLVDSRKKQLNALSFSLFKPVELNSFPLSFISWCIVMMIFIFLYWDLELWARPLGLMQHVTSNLSLCSPPPKGEGWLVRNKLLLKQTQKRGEEHF